MDSASTLYRSLTLQDEASPSLSLVVSVPSLLIENRGKHVFNAMNMFIPHCC